MRNRPGRAWLFTSFLFPAVASAAAITADPQGNVRGHVSDTSGEAVDGAVIYLTPSASACRVETADRTGGGEDPGCREVVQMTTETGGWFHGSASFGRYHVAVVKPGYELLLTDVGLFPGGVMDLRLRRAGNPRADRREGETPGASLDWILRRRLDALRDTGPAVADDPREGEAAGGENPDPASADPATTIPARGALAALLRPFDGEVAWSLSGKDPFGEAPPSGQTAGRTASVAVAGGIGGGDAGHWSVSGLVDRAATGLAGPSARRDLRSGRLGLAMDYRLGDEDRLSGEVRYGLARAEIQSDPGSAAPAGPEQPAGQVQRVAAIRSRWERRFDDTASLYVDGAYQGAGLEWLGPDEAVGAGAAEAGTTRRLDAYTARAGYVRGVGRHAVNFGFRATVQDAGVHDGGVALASPGSTAAAVQAAAVSGIGLFGLDDWRLADRYVLNYGLGYRGGHRDGGSWLVPAVGMSREPDGENGLWLRSMLVLRVEDPLQGASGEATSRERSGTTRVGCVLGVERRPVHGTRLAVTLLIAPFQEDLLAGGEGLDSLWAGDGSVVLVDGEADRRELGVALDRRFGELRGTFSSSIGRVSGRLSPVLEDLPLQTLGEGEVRYQLTRLTGLYAPTDTEVIVDIRRVVGSSARVPAGEIEAHDYRRIDLIVQQDLPGLGDAARWRLLMAYRGLDYGAADGAAGGLTAGTVSRLSGGVSVVF